MLFFMRGVLYKIDARVNITRKKGKERFPSAKRGWLCDIERHIKKKSVCISHPPPSLTSASSTDVRRTPFVNSTNSWTSTLRCYGFPPIAWSENRLEKENEDG
eukprot:GEMP01070633.1.p1 GENE.GEMP01070633.1~~GEMP01070633.1.p1  ORF type:complete len:103 (-),score=6.83 GEMP01070633.1:150-458(-)